MLTFCVITIAIVAVGVLSYFSSAWYGLKNSNLDKLPPHYTHLRQQLKKSSQRPKDYESQADEISY